MNTNKAIQQRLYSLDALRGFDMFWIIGAEEVFHEMGSITHHPFWEGLSAQFEHPVWNGFTVYDLIFPLFIFSALMFPFVMQMCDITTDKETKIRQALRTIGLLDSAY
jgi:predicted acyltransferase